MKNRVLILAIILVSLFNIGLDNTETQAITILCSGDRTVICAKGIITDGGTWVVYGDHSVTQL